jgi:hypothetical protein
MEGIPYTSRILKRLQLPSRGSLLIANRLSALASFLDNQLVSYLIPPSSLQLLSPRWKESYDLLFLGPLYMHLLHAHHWQSGKPMDHKPHGIPSCTVACLYCYDMAFIVR